MASKIRPTISDIFDDENAIPQALSAAIRDTALEHKQKGLPLAVWREGNVAWIPPEEIEVGHDLPSEVPE